MNISKRMLGLLFGFCSLWMATSASAGLISNPLSVLLPESGTLLVDLDGDAVDDIGLAEDCCRPDNTWVSLFGMPAEAVRSWGSIGDVIDGALAWAGGDGDYMPLGGQVVGLNYIPVRYTSIGNYFGYITLDYNGTDLVLTSFTYEDSGRGLTIGGPGPEVPEPASLLLMGLGLAGLGLGKRKQRTR